jgi:hypothetical protein
MTDGIATAGHFEVTLEMLEWLAVLSVEQSMWGPEMKLIAAAVMISLTCGASLADDNATRFRIESGIIVVAQSYCSMCVDSSTSCRLRCNGSGTCIQACDDELRNCREQNCRSRIR